MKVESKGKRFFFFFAVKTKRKCYVYEFLCVRFLVVVSGMVWVNLVLVLFISRERSKSVKRKSEFYDREELCNNGY